MTNNNSIEVTVKEAAHEDVGRGIARLSLDAMKALNLVSGDVIEIEGRQKAATLVWPGFPQDTGKAVLRIDGSTRGNVGAGIDDKVDLIVCNLILEFVDVERFFEQVRLASHDDTVVSLIFQKKNAVQVVSNSGVVAIQKLKDFNQEVKEADIEARIAEHGYQVRSKLKTTLIDGKELIRIDFTKPRAA